MSTKSLITAPNVNGDFFIPANCNGGVYGLNWDFKDGSTPSTLTVQVVSDCGLYTILPRDLSYSKVQTVTFGNLTFQGYLTDFSINASPDQKTLTLEYTDTSADLERYFVGLYGRWGYATDITNHLIIVGKAYAPCDAALASSHGAAYGSNYDACDPCPFMPLDKFSNSCNGTITSPAALNDFKAYEVWYTFEDLLNQLGYIPNIGINFLGGAYTSGSANSYLGISNNNNGYPFRSQATGTVKSVLDAWCNDLGLSWYWDPFQNTLFFIDRGQPIVIDAANIASDPLIVDLKYGATKKGTFSRGFSGYFSKEGTIKNYKCTLDPSLSFVNTKPLTFADLISVNGDDDYDNNGGQYDFLDKIQISTALSYYSKTLRDSFLWLGYYGISHGCQSQNNGNNGFSAEEAVGQNLIEFGNMNILEVYSDSSPQGHLHDSYTKLTSTLSPFYNKIKTEYAGENIYFIVATYDEDLAQEQYSDCQDRASNLLGKYWFTPYETPIPGGSNSNTNLSIETSDGGSGNWYISNGSSNNSKTASNDLASLPLFKFGFDADSPLGKYIEATSADDAYNSGIIDSGVSGGGNYVTGEIDKPIKSFILATRNSPQWWPTKDDGKNYSALYDWYDYYMPKLLTEDGKPETILSNIYPDSVTDPTIKLFIVREFPNEYSISLEEATNDLEPPAQVDKYDIQQDVLGNPIKIHRGMYGLTNNNAWTLSINENGNPAMIITLPVGAFTCQSLAAGGCSNGDFGLENSYNPGAFAGQTDVTAATAIASGSDVNYTVFVKAEQDFPKVLPKVEYIHQKTITQVPNAGDPSDVAQIDYHYKEIKEENLNLLGGGKQSCIPSYADIDAYIDGLSQNSAYSMSQARQKISYKVPGVNPTSNYGVADGLASVGVSLTSNGFFTSYSLEDKIVVPPSDSYVMQMLIAKTLPRGDLGSSLQNGEDAKMIGYSYSNINNTFGKNIGGNIISPQPGSYKQ